MPVLTLEQITTTPTATTKEEASQGAADMLAAAARRDPVEFRLQGLSDPRGIEVIPVPVYYPGVTEILGRRVVRTLAEIEGALDIVDVFRRPEDLEAHLPDLLAKKPSVVWLQTGIRHDAFAERLTAYFQHGKPMSVDQVRTVTFRTKKRGYTEAQVDLLLDAVVDVMLAVR